MKITIIGLDHWGYNKYIVRALERKGITARHIDYHKIKYHYPSKLHRGLNFFSKILFNFNFKRHHLNIVLMRMLESTPKQDYILIIKGDDLSIKTIKAIKSHTKNLYAFFNDSTERYPRMKKIHSYFDKVYSFDRKDVQKFQFNFISNFIYFQKTVDTEIEYDVFNISSLDKRTELLPQFAAFFKRLELNYKLIALSKKIPEDLQNLGIEFTQKQFELNDILNNYVKRSKVLLDLQRPKQLGLSFRVFEALELEKKLITTNQDVVHYDFFNPNNILVVDPNNVQIPESFFDNPYSPIVDNIIDNYRINRWVEQVFNLKTEQLES